MSDSFTGAEYIAWEPLWEVREGSGTGLHETHFRSWYEACTHLFEGWERFVADDIHELKLCIVNCPPCVHLHGRVEHGVCGKGRHTVASWKRYGPSNPPVHQDCVFLAKMPVWKVVTSKELQHCTGFESSQSAWFPFSEEGHDEGVQAYNEGARAFLAGEIKFVALELECPCQVVYHHRGTTYRNNGWHNVTDMRSVRPE